MIAPHAFLHAGPAVLRLARAAPPASGAPVRGSRALLVRCRAVLATAHADQAEDLAGESRGRVLARLISDINAALR